MKTFLFKMRNPALFLLFFIFFLIGKSSGQSESHDINEENNTNIEIEKRINKAAFWLAESYNGNNEFSYFNCLILTYGKKEREANSYTAEISIVWQVKSFNPEDIFFVYGKFHYDLECCEMKFLLIDSNKRIDRSRISDRTMNICDVNDAPLKSMGLGGGFKKKKNVHSGLNRQN